MSYSVAEWHRQSACLRSLAPFTTTEEAWFWFVRTEKSRLNGARNGEEICEIRPCDPDDIYRCIAKLYADRILLASHLDVLGAYGFLDRVPFPDFENEVVDWVIWTDAMDVIDPFLRERGIVV